MRLKILFYFIIIIIIIFLFTACESNKIEKLVATTDLSIDWWQLKQQSETEWRQVAVPFNLTNVLTKDTTIQRIIFRDFPEKNSWIEDSTWECLTTFFVDKNKINEDNINLIFEGLDTYAEIYLNDSILFFANNAFRRWSIDCKDRLVDGNNKIYIKFIAPKQKQKELLAQNSYFLTDSGQSATRKPMYHFDSELGFRYVEANIFKKVYLERWDNAKIENVEYITKKLSDSTAQMTAIFEINATTEKNVELGLIVNDTIFHNINVDLKTGTNKYELNFDINNYELWWTHDLGTPYLYSFSASLKIGKKIQKKDCKYGIRTIEITISKSGFDMTLNGEKLWLRGATFAPLGLFYTQINDNDYTKIVSEFTMANFNIIRVWEGGMYEKELFYNLCDQEGLLVWQDFMLPYKIYPNNPEFLENLKQECKENVINLRNHPSIAFWYGSNEIDNYWKDNKLSNIYSSKDSIDIFNTNKQIFKNILINIVAENDSKRNYYTSSTSAYYTKLSNFTKFEEEEIFYNFKMTAFPVSSTINSFTNASDRKIGSEIIKYHKRPYISEAIISNEIAKKFDIPKDLGKYGRLTQLVQKENVAIDLDSKVKNKENIFFELINDYSLVISPLPIDNNLKWKESMFLIKNSLENLQLFVNETGGIVNISVFSKRKEVVKSNILVKVYDFNGRILWKKTYNISIKPDDYRTYAIANISQIVAKYGKENIVLKTEVIEDKNIITQNHYCFTDTRNLKLKKPSISLSFFKIEGGHAVELTTNRFAKNVYLWSNENGIFDNNFFDLVPGETKIVKFYHKKTIDKIEEKVKAKNYFSF